MPSYQGKYHPKNPQKYIGDASNIIFRSLWERTVMMYLDNNSNVLRWASEEIAIPYVSPLDSKVHRYFPDFLVIAKHEKYGTVTMLLEVKPEKETIPPVKRNGKKFLAEMSTYATNMAKFEAAEKYCKEKNWEFKVLTEKDIFPKKANGRRR